MEQVQNHPDSPPELMRIKKCLNEGGPEFSIPKSELDAMPPAHQKDVKTLLSQFALGHLSENDFRYLFRIPGAALYFPPTPFSGEVSMVNMDGTVELMGDADAVAELQADDEDALS